MRTNFVPDRLIKVREAMHLNKSQTAALLGLSPIGYLRYEQGFRTPSHQMLQVIALTLNTSVSYLSGETEDSSPDQVLISKSENADLFDLIQEFNALDASQTKRLLAYFKKITDK